MFVRSLELSCCPACKKKYRIDAIETDGNQIEKAFLSCPQCAVTIPVLNGFPLFQEQFLSKRFDTEQILERVFGNTDLYIDFLEAKKNKPAYDLYAAFQPFNESTQALFPLIEFFRDL